jgi:hypothetical protein
MTCAMTHNIASTNNFCKYLKERFPDIQILKIKNCCFFTIILPSEMNFIIKKLEVSFVGYNDNKIITVKLIDRYGKLINGGEHNPLQYDSTFQSINVDELVEDIAELYNIHRLFF